MSKNQKEKHPVYRLWLCVLFLLLILGVLLLVSGVQLGWADRLPSLQA